ncbi:MAG: hypothetical protein ABFD92_02495 [Planctomycetaceae bacterium]|nr:hypothetical protein [Planctomycetaceae bacterium]
MRWTLFVVVAYVVLLMQTTVGGLITFPSASLGTIGPDLVAIVGVFIALNARTATMGMLAAWGLGLGLDLTTATAPGCATAIGPMAIAYAVAAGVIFYIREGFYFERPLPQAFLAAVFCLMSHLLWVTYQSVLARGAVLWVSYGQMVLQAVLLSIYTGLLAPIGYLLLRKLRRWLIPVPATARGRRGTIGHR